jgi:hypothetical protein
MRADVLIVGGGTGGCAAALAAASLGHSVILTERCGWIGGQLTSQAVPPDDHVYIEQFGTTRRYRRYGALVREYYRQHYPLTTRAFRDPTLNPGAGNVSRLCHEPRVGVAVLEQMMAYHRATGRLRVLTGYDPAAADTAGDTVRSVTLRSLTGHPDVTVEATYVLDATELGDLLPLAGAEYVSGAESQRETGEPHALPDAPDPEDVQSFTWCFCMSYDPNEDRTIARPADYDFWRSYVPALTPSWGGPLLSFTNPHPITLAPDTHAMFPTPGIDAFGLWAYRRILAGHQYDGDVPVADATIVNWPQNDYWGGNIIDKSEAEVRHHLEMSKRQSLALLYWLQTEAPHPRGDGSGYPGLHLRPDLMGTIDGFAQHPYIREARRIRAEFTVTECHLGSEIAPVPEAALFKDSVGVGWGRMDLHPSTGGRNFFDIPTLPFHIPLSALIPVRLDNLLPAAKNIGTTHVTNGAYRLHSTEWNIGEAAGLLAAFCLERGVKPRAVSASGPLLVDYQALLRAQGFELEWPRVEGAVETHRWDPTDRHLVKLPESELRQMGAT